MKTKNKILIIFTITASLLGMAMADFDFAAARPNDTIDVSAYLVNNQNEEIANGEYEVRFAFYTTDRQDANASDSGSRIWEETQKVIIIDGILRAYLGTVNPLLSSINFNEGEYYLGIKISTDSEMVPRKKIGAVPSAINASYLNGATIGTGAGDILVLGNNGKVDIKSLSTGTKKNTLALGDDGRFHDQDTDTGTDSLDFNIGNGSALAGNNFTLSVSSASARPALRFSGSASAWQFSNDGISFTDFGAGDYLSLTGGTMTGDIVFAASQMVGVANGGTGISSFTAGDMIYYSSGDSLAKLAAGDEGYVLKIVSGVPSWSSSAPPGDHSLLSASHPDTSPAAVQRGDLIIGQDNGGLNKWTRLVLGSSGYILRSNGTDVAWSPTTNITQLGTVTAGTWSANAIGAQYGGTDINTSASTGVPTISAGTWSVASLLGVTLGGTGTSTQFTPGSVVFAGASGVYNQDNTNLFWDNTNKRLGIGTASPAYPLHVNFSYSGTAEKAAAYVKYSLTSALNNSNPEYGIMSELFLNGSVDYTGGNWGNNAIWPIAYGNTTGTITQLNAGRFSAFNLAAGTITHASAVRTYLENLGGGTITNAYGIHVENPYNYDGTISNVYGVYVADQTAGASNNFALYTAGLAKSYFGGNVGIGQTTPTAALHIKAGTATAGTAPLKLTSGTSLTTPEAGAFEYDGTDLYFTPSAARETIAFSSDLHSAVTLAGSYDYLTILGQQITLNQIDLTTDVTGILPLANGGTGTSTAFTQGSVVFAGASGVYSQDNTNLFWDNTNKRLGIGTASPSYRLNVKETRTDTAGTIYLHQNYLTAIPSNASNATFYVQHNRVQFDGVASGATLGGIYNEVRQQASSGTMANMYGVKNLIINNWPATTNAYGTYNEVYSMSDGITNAYGSYNTFGSFFGAPITNGYGVYVANFPSAVTNQWAIYTEGTARSYFGGNVGIGDTTPDTLLDLLSSSAANTQLTMTNINAGDYDTQIGFQLAEGTNLFTMGIDDSDSDKFKISTTGLGTDDRLVIDSSGNVGIGTASPTASLEIFGTSNKLKLTYSSSITDYTQLYVDSDGRLNIFAKSSAEWSNNNLVQIGQASSYSVAGSMVYIKAGDYPAMLRLHSDVNNTGGGNEEAYITFGGGSTPSFSWYMGTEGPGVASQLLRFGYGSSGWSKPGANDLLVINPSGNVGIGQTTPTAALHLKAGTATAGTAPLKLTSGTSLTTPEAGAFEFDGTDLYFTPSAARETIAYMSDITAAAHSPVTLAGSYDYLTILGQQITLNQIDLTTDVTGILPLANGGTGTSTAFTQGSVVFAGASGVYSQDNTNLFWDNTNKRLGIGTASPITQLHVPGKVPTDATGSVSTGSGSYPRDVYVQGRYVYVVSAGTSTLQVIDVSNPSSPVVKGTASTGASSDPYAVHVLGKYAYVLNNWPSRLKIFDVSDPSSPTEISSTYADSWPSDVYVQGRYAYIVREDGGFGIYDVSNPTSPVGLGSATLSAYATSIYVQGKYAYMTDLSNKLNIYDVSNPSSPTSVGSVVTGAQPYSVYVQGRYAYVVNYSANTLQIFDVSTPASPTSVGSVATGASPFSIYVQDRYAYVTKVGTSDNLHVFDVSNPASPTSVGTVSTNNDPDSVFVQGRYAYVDTGASTLQIFDVGGSYIQQLEAGGIETATLQVRNNMTVNNDLDVRGGAIFGRGINVTDKSAFYGDAYFGGNIGIGTVSPSGRLHSYISNSAVTTSQYTGYFENLATNTTTDAINKYGAYITSTGTFTGSTGTATNNYGLYVNTPSGADNNYAAVFAGGNVGIGQTSPTAALHIKAGTATAGTAPLKLTSGTSLTTPEAGAFEYDGTDLYFTPSAARETIAFSSDLHSAVTLAGSYDYLTILGQQITLNQIDLTTDVTGILPLANGGTGTSTAFTQGSVVFAGASGVYSQDNTNLFWDNTNKRLGIGTASPNNTIQVADLINFNNTDYNSLLGYQAGKNIASGAQYNTFVGYQAGYSDAASTNAADWNTGIGYKTLYSNTTGYSNLAIGSAALYSNTTGYSNLAMGSSALYFNTTGHSNLAMGLIALNSNTIGNYNVAIGEESLRYSTEGNSNTAMGYGSGKVNIGGNYNVFLGSSAGASNDYGNYNTFLGVSAGYANIASNNVLIGYQAGDSNTSGANNTIIGYQAGQTQTTATRNTFLGYQAGYVNTASDNLFIGYQAGDSVTSGIYNTLIGVSSGQAITTNGYNTFIGYQTGFNTTGYQNSAIGVQSLYSNTTGAWNSAMGNLALYRNTTGDSNLAIGYLALYNNTTGSANSAIGNYALYLNTTGLQNSAMGYQALLSNTEGNYNLAIGKYALYSNQTGSANTAMGVEAGNGVSSNSFSNNSLFGYRAGYGLSTGSNNILLGYQAGDNLTTGASNIIIGYDIDAPLATSANTLNIGNLLFGTGIDGTGTTLSSGNIGIGTVSPSGRLHSYISNSAATTSQYTGYFENLATNTTTDAINKYGAYITSTGTFTGSTGTATNNYGLYVNTPSGADNNYAAVFAGGNVGIGTTSPSEKLSMYRGNFLQTLTGSSPENGPLPVKGYIQDFTNIGTGEGLYISGKYAYVASYNNNRLTIIDISNPALPVVEGTVQDNTYLDGAEKVVVAGKYAYVAVKDTDRLTVVDISNPNTPVVTGSVTSSQLDGAIDVYVSGKYAYVAASEASRMTIVDISNPASPSILGSVNDATKLALTFSVYVSGKYAYATGFTNDYLSIIDISNPASPAIVGSVTNATTLNGARGAYVSGKYAYVAAYANEGLAVVDISNPASPSIVGSVASSSYFDDPRKVYVSGDYAYVAGYWDTTIVDISSPTAPVIVAYGDGGSALYNAADVFVSGKYVYIVTNAAKLGIFDLYGINSPAGNIGDLFSSSIEVADSVDIGNNLYVRNGINIGQGGILTDGGLSVGDSAYFGGNVGIGQTSPTAALHIKAGTATAGTAPLKLTSGTSLTTPEAGAFEYDGTDLYFTPSAARETIAFSSDLHSAVTLAGAYDYLTIIGQEITLNQIDLAADVTGILPLANGGTGSSSFTAGSVIFSNGTILTQDNANFFWDDTNNRLGIGTTSPQQKLTLGSASNFAVEMAVPASPSATPTTGGTLAAATYYYKVTALDGAGETTGSSEVSCIVDGVTTTACQIDWTASTGASSYRIYGRAAGAQDQYWTATTNTYTDTGTAGTAGTVPTTTTSYVNKLAASGNSWVLGGNFGIGTATPNNTIQVADLINFDNDHYVTSLGYQAGYNNTTGTYNSFIGSFAGYSNTTGTENTALGDSALYSNNWGIQNSAVGYKALYANTGSNNSAMGYFALSSNTTGGSNSAMGHQALFYNTTGGSNSAMGKDALFSNATGGYNTVMGFQAGYGIWPNSFSNSVLVGYRAGYGLTTGNNNILIGYQAGDSITSASDNTIIGYQAGQTQTTATRNTFLGYQAGYLNTASNNTFIGYQAGYVNTTGNLNSAMGTYALYANSAGVSNSAMGYSALGLNTVGNYNSAIGENALSSNTGGSLNSAMGYNALYSNKTGNYNTVMGVEAGFGLSNNSFSNNSLFGYRAGYGLTTGSNNILLGYQAGNNLTTGASNIIIGYDIDAPLASSANTLNIGNLIFGTGIDGTGTTLSSGKIGIGVVSPAAALHIKAGTATAGTAPLKLTSGTSLTTPEAGAFEYDGTDLYFTPSAARETIAFSSDLHSAVTLAGSYDYLTILGQQITLNQIDLTTDVTGILPLANGGTGTSTAFTQGSVVFAGASGVYSQDNTNLFWDNTNKRLGIGTAVPSAALHIGAGSPASLTTYGDSVFISGELEVGETAYLGPMEFGANSGAISWIDMPVTAAASIGTVESYTAKIDGTDLLTIYAESDGTGGIQNARVGIGDTTPDTLLDLLSSSAANTQLTMTNTNAGDYDTQIGFQLAEGTNLFTMGVDDSDSDKFKISTTGLGTNDRLVIDASGNVGIGTASLGAGLQIATNSVASTPGELLSGTWFTGGTTTTTKPHLLVEPTGTTSGAWSTSGTGLGINAATGFTGNLIDAQLVNATKFSVASTGEGYFAGNVGIKVTPSYPLDVYSTNSSRLVNIYSSAITSTHYGMYVSVTGVGTNGIGGYFSSTNSTNNYGIIVANGSVGIGDTSPDSLLDMSSSAAADTYLKIANTDATNTYDSGIQFELDSDGTVKYTMGVDNNDSEKFKISTTALGTNDRLVIDSSGNVGIGTTNPGAALHVYDDASADYVAEFYNDGNNTDRYGLLIQAGEDTPAGTNTLVQFNDGDGTAVGSITYNNTQTYYNTSSDVRLKENVALADIGINNLMNIQIKQFNFKSDPTKELAYGVIAQELYNVYPQAVVIPENDTKYWQVDYSKLTPLIVKSLQDQQNILETHNLELETQDMEITGLTLKTGENIETLEDLQKAADENFVALGSIINNQQLVVGKIESRLKDAEIQIADYQLRITSIEELQAKIQEQIDELRKLTNQETSLAQIDLNKNDIDYIKLVLGLDRVGNVGDVSILGKFTAEEIETGALVVKVMDEERKTIGEASILPVKTDANNDGLDDETVSDGKSVFVKTKAVKSNSRVFVTPKTVTDQPLAVTEIREGEGFRVEVKNPVASDVVFDWLIVEEK